MRCESTAPIERVVAVVTDDQTSWTETSSAPETSNLHIPLQHVRATYAGQHGRTAARGPRSTCSTASERSAPWPSTPPILASSHRPCGPSPAPRPAAWLYRSRSLAVASRRDNASTRGSPERPPVIPSPDRPATATPTWSGCRTSGQASPQPRSRPPSGEWSAVAAHHVLDGSVRTTTRSPCGPNRWRISTVFVSAGPNQCSWLVSNSAASPGCRVKSRSPMISRNVPAST